jgi:hypothetical protein
MIVDPAHQNEPGSQAPAAPPRHRIDVEQCPLSVYDASDRTRCQRAPMIATSNKPFSAWGDQFGDHAVCCPTRWAVDAPTERLGGGHRDRPPMHYELSRELLCHDFNGFFERYGCGLFDCGCFGFFVFCVLAG